jgi:hypothetical protein
MYVSNAPRLGYIRWTIFRALDHITQAFIGVFDSKELGSRGWVAGITSQPSSCKPHKTARSTYQPNLDYPQFHVLELNRYHRQKPL